MIECVYNWPLILFGGYLVESFLIFVGSSSLLLFVIYLFVKPGIMGRIVSLQNSCGKVLASRTSECDWFGDKFFKEAMKVQCGHCGGPWSGVTGGPARRGSKTQIHTGGRGRGHGERAVVHMPRGEASPSSTLTLGFQPPVKSCCLSPRSVALCYGPGR